MCWLYRCRAWVIPPVQLNQHINSCHALFDCNLLNLFCYSYICASGLEHCKYLISSFNINLYNMPLECFTKCVSVNKRFFPPLRKRTVMHSSSHNQLISVQPCWTPAGTEDVSLNRSQIVVYVLYLKEPGEELSGCCGETEGAGDFDITTWPFASHHFLII